MSPDDRSMFASTVTATLELYRQSVSEAALSMWWAALQPFELREVQAGLQAHIQDAHRGRFAPVPADVIGHVEELRGESLPARPAIEQKGEWAKLLRRYGIPASQTAGMEGDQVWDLIQRAHKAQRSSRVQLRALEGGKA
ncbi:hypothetical protein [Thioalkalivibrio sp. ALE12]|uniref:hypothetical protein n=1 Tax=Thioalkalivibrio sp. ALE12 TaxID=1158170 RepID=UPI00036F42C4|nr:hypothetical protein [Thioalkalivibrio sp. ALE12]